MTTVVPGGLRRALRRYRRWIAAVLAGSAVLAFSTAVRPPAPRLVPVLVAARTLPAGVTLAAGDLTVARWPAQVVPSGALRAAAEAAGRVVAGAVRRGEPITDVRLVGPGLLAGGPAGDGRVAAPVRVADAAEAGLVRPGDRIDVLATPPDGAGAATAVADDVLVLAVPPPDGSGSADGALVVVAASRQVAVALARAAVGDRLSLTVRPPPGSAPGDGP